MKENTQNIQMPTSYGSFTNTNNAGLDIPFMYFTPRDAIKFQQQNIKNPNKFVING